MIMMNIQDDRYDYDEYIQDELYDYDVYIG